MDTEENDAIYQLYTIISDPNNLGGNSQDQPIILLTLKNDGETEDERDITDEIDFTNEEIQETPPVLSNLKLITLNDGRLYVTAANNDDEDLETVEPHLISSTPEDILQEENNTTKSEALEETSNTLDNSEYREIELEDGTRAIFNINLMEPLEKVEKKAPPEKPVYKYKCGYKNCEKMCTTAHHLRVHVRSHTGLRPYHCDVVECGKSFTTGYSLKAHMRTHTGEKPYGCSLCEKHFKTSGDLQKHVRIHTGEKPFKCPIENCGRSFTTSNIRKVHIRSHTGERPYSCQYRNCGKAFASATNYKNHMRIHSGEKPYVCQVEGCGRRFTEYSSLYKHNSVHQPYKPYICTYCGQQCKQESTLKAHKRAIHDIVIMEDGTEIMVTQDAKLTNILVEVAKGAEKHNADCAYLKAHPEEADD